MSITDRHVRPDDPAAAFGKSSSNAEASDEQRRHRRARAAWPARILSPAGCIIHVTVCDVSEGGVGLLGKARLPLGTVVDVTLSVPHAREPQRTQTVTARVRVMFSSSVGANSRVGVQFIALPMDARIAIRTYVLANSRPDAPTSTGHRHDAGIPPSAGGG